MKLNDRLLQQHGLPDAEDLPSSMIGGTLARRRFEAIEGTRRLRTLVHNRLLETLDVAKLDALEPAAVASKVTAAINDVLDHEGRLLTEADRARLVSEIKNELLGFGSARAAAPR